MSLAVSSILSYIHVLHSYYEIVVGNMSLSTYFNLLFDLEFDIYPDIPPLKAASHFDSIRLDHLKNRTFPLEKIALAERVMTYLVLHDVIVASNRERIRIYCVQKD